jgi:hypothetical protein
MTVQFVSYKVREESVAEVEAGIEAMMAALKEQHPEGVRYAMGMLPDRVTIVGVLELDDGVHNPLLRDAAAGEYLANLEKWVDGDRPKPRPLRVIGSYRLFE